LRGNMPYPEERRKPLRISREHIEEPLP